jgi:hypothetical protein
VTTASNGGMDTDDDFMSNVSSEDDILPDDSDNDGSGDEGWFPLPASRPASTGLGADRAVFHLLAVAGVVC